MFGEHHSGKGQKYVKEDQEAYWESLSYGNDRKAPEKHLNSLTA